MDLASKQNTIFDIGIESITEHLRTLGLTVEIESDFASLSEFLSSEGTFVNPTYNPKYSDLGAEDFWVRILDEDGATVASCAERTLWTADLMRMIGNGSLWYRGGFSDIGGPDSVPVLTPSQPVRGKVGSSGATFTVPAWRRHGLAQAAMWLTRLVSFRDFGTALSTCFVRESLARTTIPTLSYGYEWMEKVLDGYFPPQRGPETLYLCWVDRATMARRVLDLPRHPINPMTLVVEGASPVVARAA